MLHGHVFSGVKATLQIATGRYMYQCILACSDSYTRCYGDKTTNKML